MTTFSKTNGGFHSVGGGGGGGGGDGLEEKNLEWSPNRHSRSFSDSSLASYDLSQDRSQEGLLLGPNGGGAANAGGGNNGYRIAGPSKWRPRWFRTTTDVPRARPSSLLALIGGVGCAILLLLLSGTFKTGVGSGRGQGHTIDDLWAEKQSLYLMPVSTFYAYTVQDFLDRLNTTVVSNSTSPPPPFSSSSTRTQTRLRQQDEQRRRRRQKSIALSRPGLSRSQASRLDMTQLECEAEFPLFEPLIEGTLRKWSARIKAGRTRGGVRKVDIDQAERTAAPHWGWSRVLIDDNQVFIRSVKFNQLGIATKSERISGVLYLVHQAVTTTPSSDPPLPPVDLLFSMADGDAGRNENPSWALDRRVGETGPWLVPDYGFAGWPSAGIGSMAEVFREIDEVERTTPWQLKGDKAFWRGLPNHYRIREDLLEKVSVPGARAWSDVRAVEINPIPAAFAPPEGWTLPVSIPQHCAHRFLLHAEGNAYSGRLKYLLGCGGEDGGEAVGSVAIAHPMAWEQHFHVALNDAPIPASVPRMIRGAGDGSKSRSGGWFGWRRWGSKPASDLRTDSFETSRPLTTTQNFVTVPGPLFNGLEETVQELRRDDAKAREIARNAARTLRRRYLTPAATVCYTRWALRAYGMSMAEGGYTPRGWEGMSDGPVGTDGNGEFFVRPGGGVRKLPSTETMEGDIEYGSWITLGMPERIRNWALPPQQ